MNKTGIAITVTSNGMSQPVIANPGQWTRHISDIRPILGCITPSCDSSSPHPLIYMTFSSTGTYIAVARAISGRAGDNVTAWLYIPDHIDIHGDEIASIIEHLDSLIKADRLPDENELTEEFADCYALSDTHTCESFASDTQGPLAWRCIGTDGLDELAGTFRRRPYYAGYCGIVLAGEGQSVSGATDLTEYSLDDIDNDIDPSGQNTDSLQPSDTPAAHISQPAHGRFGLCRQWQPYALGAMAGFILGLITAWAIGYSPVESSDTISAADRIQNDTLAAPVLFTAQQLASATAYLDTHKVWVKADMDTIPPLAGLWDALNECRYDTVAGYAIRLDGSETLKAITDTLATFSSGPLYGKPLNSDNRSITVETYGSLLREAAKALKQQ